MERGARMSLRQRHGVTVMLAYFMAWCVVGSPAIPTELFSPGGLGLVVVIGTPTALLGWLLNVRADREERAKKKG